MSYPGLTKPRFTLAPILLRPMRTGTIGQNEQGHVIRTWVDSHRGRMCDGPAYRKGQWRLAQALIEVCPVMLAVDEEYPESILGWACTDQDIVHYVWVEPRLRRNGIAKELLDPYLRRTSVIYSHAPCRMWQTRGVGNKDKFNVNPDGSRDTVVPIPAGWSFSPFAAFETAALVSSYAIKPSASTLARVGMKPSDSTGNRDTEARTKSSR